MKQGIMFCLVIAAFVASSHAVPVYQEGDRYGWIPDGKGVMHYVDLQDDSGSTQRFDPDQDIVYLLFTRKNPTEGQVIKRGDVESLSSSNFDVNKPVKFTIHGWTEDKDSGTNTVITEAFLNAMDVNMITVDWSVGSQTGYLEAVRNVLTAGASVGGFVDWLNTVGVPFSAIHLVGHSLGGQLVGIAGRSCKQGQVEYITSLDPAFPSWPATSSRIRKTDGLYVELIHSCAGFMGMLDAVGHNDFYPNGAKHPMPGCDVAQCSHERSREYFAFSLENENFIGTECLSQAEALAGVESCTGNRTLYLGGSRIKPEMGIFALNTNAERPYYQTRKICNNDKNIKVYS